MEPFASIRTIRYKENHPQDSILVTLDGKVIAADGLGNLYKVIKEN